MRLFLLLLWVVFSCLPSALHAEDEWSPEEILNDMKARLESGTPEDWNYVRRRFLHGEDVINILRLAGERRLASIDLADIGYEGAYIELYTYVRLIASREEREARDIYVSWYCDPGTIVLNNLVPFKESTLKEHASPSDELLHFLSKQLAGQSRYADALFIAERRHILESLVHFATPQSLRIWLDNKPWPFGGAYYDLLAQKRHKPAVTLFILDLYNKLPSPPTSSMERYQVQLLDILFKSPYIILDYFGDPIAEIESACGIPTTQPEIDLLCAMLSKAASRTDIDLPAKHRDEFRKLAASTCKNLPDESLADRNDVGDANRTLQLPAVDTDSTAEQFIMSGTMNQKLAGAIYVFNNQGGFERRERISFAIRLIDDKVFMGELYEAGRRRMEKRRHFEPYSFEKDFLEMDAFLASISGSMIPEVSLMLLPLYDRDEFLRPEKYELRSRYIVFSYMRNLRPPSDPKMLSFLRDVLDQKNEIKLGFYDYSEIFCTCLHFGNQEFVKAFREHDGYRYVTFERIASYRDRWRVAAMLLEDLWRGQEYMSNGSSSAIEMLFRPKYEGFDFLYVDELVFSPLPIAVPIADTERAEFMEALRGIVGKESPHIDSIDREKVRKFLATFEQKE